MSAVFVRPLAFTVIGQSAAPIGGSQFTHLAVDEPAMVCRMGLASYLIIDLGAGAEYDYIAFAGTNLRPSDTIQVRTGTTATGVGGYAGAVGPAYTGQQPYLMSATIVIPLGTIRTERFVRIDLAAPSHPDGYIEASRLIVGKGAKTIGVQQGAEFSVESDNEVSSGPGWEAVAEHRTQRSWKIATGFVTDAVYRRDWMPLLAWCAKGRGVLFIPADDLPHIFATDAIFGRVQKAGGKLPHIDAWTAELTIKSLGQ